MTAAGHVYLAASTHGDAFSTMVGRALDAAKERIARAGESRKPRVALSYAAVADSFGGRTFMKGYALKTFWGADAHPFYVAGEHTKMAASEAEAIVANADVIFLAGGDPVLGARLLCDAGADAWLRAARARGAACMGISAGSMMLSAWWASWPDEPPPGAPFEGGTLVRCTGVADVVVDCHAEEDDWAELKLVRGMLDARGHADLTSDAPIPRLFGLPTGCGMILGPNGEMEWLGATPYEG